MPLINKQCNTTNANIVPKKTTQKGSISHTFVKKKAEMKGLPLYTAQSLKKHDQNSAVDEWG